MRLYVCIAEITTIEGIISRAIRGLSQEQALRLVEHPADAAQVAAFLERLARLQSGAEPFTLELEDISGECLFDECVTTVKQQAYPTNIINVTVCEDGCMYVCISFAKKLLDGFG